jgi:hypothetical protein
MYISKLLRKNLGIKNYKVENVWAFYMKTIYNLCLKNLAKKTHQLENCYIMKGNTKWGKKKQNSNNNEKMKLQQKKSQKMKKYAMELTSGARIGVKASTYTWQGQGKYHTN